MRTGWPSGVEQRVQIDPLLFLSLYYSFSREGGRCRPGLHYSRLPRAVARARARALGHRATIISTLPPRKSSRQTGTTPPREQISLMGKNRRDWRPISDLTGVANRFLTAHVWTRAVWHARIDTYYLLSGEARGPLFFFFRAYTCTYAPASGQRIPCRSNSSIFCESDRDLGSNLSVAVILIFVFFFFPSKRMILRGKCFSLLERNCRSGFSSMFEVRSIVVLRRLDSSSFIFLAFRFERE